VTWTVPVSDDGVIRLPREIVDDVRQGGSKIELVLVGGMVLLRRPRTRREPRP
jgi:hypothetical protein